MGILDNVNKPSKEYDLYMEKSAIQRSLLKGTVGMREAGTVYLPQNVFESNTNYSKRIKRSFLFNAFKKTVSFLSGEAFQKEIEFVSENEKINDYFSQYKKDIDNKGNDINVFLKRIFIEGLSTGAAHILVLMPNTTPVNTKAEEKEQGIRPFLKEIKSKDVIGWKVDENGKLIQIRIRGKKTIEKGEYETETFEQVMVVEPGISKIYTADKNGDFKESPEITESSLEYIPLVSFIPGEELSCLTGESPLVDLSYLNVKHWQSSSDQNNILHVARVPILFSKKLDVEKIPLGTSQVINAEEDDADLKYVEISGKSIEAGRQDLEDTKVEMALYGLQQLIPRVGNMTATEKTLNSSETGSSLATWVIEFEDIVEDSLRMFAELGGIEIDKTEDLIEINKEFFIGLDSSILEIILKSIPLGVASRKMAFNELKRRGVYENDYNWDDVEAEIEEDNRNSNSFSELAGSLLGSVA